MRTIEQLLRQQKESLESYFLSVNRGEIERVVALLKNNRGSLHFSGVGKSGLIAQKITSSFVSAGIIATFLSPSDALHGDIGIVRSQDCALLFSKSGQTQELIDLVPHLKKRSVKTVGVVSAKDSKLEQMCDLTVHLPMNRELCQYDLVPTTSTVLQLLFGDLLVVALMEARRFTIADFGTNHPGGLLGRKITQTVADLMLKGDALPLCCPSDRLIDVLHELTSKKCGSLLVVDENRTLQGIFTDGDLRRAIQQQGPKALELPLSELMTKSPKVVSQEKLALHAMNLMEENRFSPVTVLPVVDEGRVVGLLRIHDILQSKF